MTGRKVLKRKRHCLEISKARWSIPSKKDFACQVEISFKQPAHAQTIATQTDSVLPAPSSEVSGVKQDGELALHADKLLDFCVNFTSADVQEATKCGSLAEKVTENGTIHKVESVFASKSHKLDELTSKNLSIKPSSFLISTSEVMRDAVSESKCSGCGKSGQFAFKKETEPQTGILKLEFICSECKKLFSVSSNSETILARTKPKCYLTNYVLLAFITCGLYYKDYDHLMGTLGISHFSKKQWIRVIEWIAPEVQKIADWSVQQSRKAIKARGDQDKLEVMFDGFYLTRGHYSNNSSATMHDAKTGNIIGYAHRTKRGQDANWEGTSDGAEGNMLDEILADLIENERMTIKKALIDKDASCHEIILTRSPETEIVFFGNHTAKTFHTELERVKKTPCQVSVQL